MCASHCDACPDVAAAARTCDDELPSSPACTFGNLCSCEEFVNAPESTGCGGVYKSDMGDMEVNSMCASHCDACPDVAAADVIQEQLLEDLEKDVNAVCKYSTADC